MVYTVECGAVADRAHHNTPQNRKIELHSDEGISELDISLDKHIHTSIQGQRIMHRANTMSFIMYVLVGG